jgi:hypothetical protein
MASWSCVLLQVNVLTLQQLHFGFSVNFDFICHFEFTQALKVSGNLLDYPRGTRLVERIPCRL